MCFVPLLRLPLPLLLLVASAVAAVGPLSREPAPESPDEALATVTLLAITAAAADEFDMRSCLTGAAGGLGNVAKPDGTADANQHPIEPAFQHCIEKAALSATREARQGKPKWAKSLW